MCSAPVHIRIHGKGARERERERPLGRREGRVGQIQASLAEMRRRFRAKVGRRLEVGQLWAAWAGLGPTLVDFEPNHRSRFDFDQSRFKVARVRANLVETKCRCRAKFGRHRAASGQSRPNIGRNWAIWAQTRATCADAKPGRAKSGPQPAQIGPKSGKFDRNQRRRGRTKIGRAAGLGARSDNPYAIGHSIAGAARPSLDTQIGRRFMFLVFASQAC